MYCKSCGSQIDDDSKFCSRCGAKQSENFSPTANTREPPESQTLNVNLSFGRQSSPATKEGKVKNRKYDLTYEKEDEATYIGIGLLILGIFFTYVFKGNNYANEDYVITWAILTIILFVLRIIITVWVSNIADRQNRNSLGWSALAFIFPSIALIIIGQLRRLKFEGQPSFAELQSKSRNKTSDPENTSRQKELTEDEKKLKNSEYRKDFRMFLLIIIGGLIFLGLISWLYW